MDPFFRYKPIFQDRPDKLLHISSYSLHDLDEYGLCLRDVALFLDKKRCLKAFKVERPKPLIELSGFTFVDTLIFSDVKLFKKAFFRCKKAYEYGWIDQKKLFKGVYFQKEVQNQVYPKVVIKWIGEGIGNGVFIEEKIRSGAFVGEYVGIVKKKKLFQRQNLYTMRYPTLYLNKKEYIIDSESFGNFTRFINHSNNPNLELESIFISPFTRMIFTAKRNIEKGEQLTFDYGKVYWKKKVFKEI